MYDRVQFHGEGVEVLWVSVVYNHRQHGSQGVKLSQHKYATKGNGWIVPFKISNGRTRKFNLKILRTILILKIEARDLEPRVRKPRDHVNLVTSYPSLATQSIIIQ